VSGRTVSPGRRTAGSPTASIVGMFAGQAEAQARMLWRMPALSATSFLLPILLFGFVGLPNADTPYLPGITLGAYMLAAFAAFAVSLTMIMNFGVTVALDRAENVDLLIRSTPMPPIVHLFARGSIAVVSALLTLVALFAFALIVGGIELPAATWLSMGLWLLVGSVTFVGLGFAIAYLVSPNAAPAVANIVFMVMAFASGMFIPLDQLPEIVAQIAPYLPTYHYAQLAWRALGVPGTADLTVSVAWLAGYAVVFFGLAIWGYRRESSRRFA
jgi:ABC-2 type transport system permease protein